MPSVLAVLGCSQWNLSNNKIVYLKFNGKFHLLISTCQNGNRAKYFDEADVNAQTSSCLKENEKTSYDSSTFSVKRVVFKGVSLFTSEFLSEEGSFSAFQQAFPSTNLDPKLFVPRSPEMAPTHLPLPVRKSEFNFQWEPILISRLSGQQELRLTLKQNKAVSGHKGYHRGISLLKDADIKLCECFGKYIVNPKSKRVWTNISLDMGSFLYQDKF